MKNNLFLFILVFLCACSASTPPQVGEDAVPTQSNAVGHTQVIAIAERIAIEKNPNVKETKSKAEFENGRWNVFIQFVMGYDDKGNALFVPGGHCSVILDESGNLIDYFPGE